MPPLEEQCKVCIVGAGTRFLSGISYYTILIANAMSQTHRTSAIMMRQLLPTRFYPGRNRTGLDLTGLQCVPSVRVLDGVDWYWLPSILRAAAFLLRERPSVMILQWWTGTVLHTYIALALLARMLGARVVIEMHEILDTGEARMPLVHKYVQLLFPILRGLAHALVVHSEEDRGILAERAEVQHLPVVKMPLGPYSQYQHEAVDPSYRKAPPECCNLLFFGVIRPFKGLEDLIRAFEAIPEERIESYWLTVVGETWENWTLPGELIAKSKYASRITFVNRYVSDKEVAGFFAGADVVVLPYHRSSASGPLHTAMSWGLPVVVTSVGGLTEAAADYQGARLVPPHDPEAIRNAIEQMAPLRGQRFADPHSWDNTVLLYDQLFASFPK